MINLNQENKILFTIIYGNQHNLSFNFAISNILSKNLTIFDNVDNIYGQSKIKKDFGTMYKLSCFITKKEIIECFFYELQYYKVGIYSKNLSFIGDIILDDQAFNDNNDLNVYKELLNCIHLTEEIGVFTYYMEMDGLTNPALILQINELIENEGVYSFKRFSKKEKIILSLNDTTLFDHNELDNYDIRYLMKINDNKFSFIYDYKDYYYNEELDSILDGEYKIIIVLIIFELYGSNNTDNLIIKYYKINPYFLNGNKVNFFYRINTFIINTYIGMGILPFYTNSESESIYIILVNHNKKQMMIYY